MANANTTALFGGPLDYLQFRKVFPPTRNFQRYDSNERANHSASHRLGHVQRQSIGRYFYTHTLLGDFCFPTAKQATQRAYEIYMAQFEKVSATNA